MKTLGNLLFASLVASVCLAPVVNSDVARALSGRALAVAGRDFATAKTLSSENSSGMEAALPQMVAHLIRPIWAGQR
jgi:hypothetical protein